MITFQANNRHSRYLTTTFKDHNGVKRTVELEVRYLGESNACNGADMDNLIMPAIKKRLFPRKRQVKAK